MQCRKLDLVLFVAVAVLIAGSSTVLAQVGASGANGVMVDLLPLTTEHYYHPDMQGVALAQVSITDDCAGT